ncbi:hypothetical protein SRCM100623_00973 [Acetobacter pasteurianus]|uniref:Uncharacterized protein n=1 Tax=Acetobacter pasteurianus TaxID=438 RepID=A0A1A0DBB8_ACEPA|nr:hypothetical protein SRCM100623_00973 [Acetobacter pasteurianus]
MIYLASSIAIGILLLYFILSFFYILFGILYGLSIRFSYSIFKIYEIIIDNVNWTKVNLVRKILVGLGWWVFFGILFLLFIALVIGGIFSIFS